MGEQYYFIIEIRIPSGPKGWQDIVNSRMKNILERLKSSIEELGGKVYIRY
ncbi:MAG: hypothetical protein NZ932_06870 [Candidatus Bathyarchaeota archaeon]|nr:hypothetical protein [Candidatus Bathyarchaeota archaeon]MDW8040272.1 hypothetical protein [Nitrososphaerota archaeon]